MTKPNTISINLVVDRSGSMASVRDSTVESINAFVESQKAVPGEARLSLHFFDSAYGLNSRPTMAYQTLIDQAPVPEVRPLTREHYVPRGGTPLLDAIGHTIDSLGSKLALTPEHERPSQVLVVVVTDGQENESTKFTRRQIVDKVRHQEGTYSWEFVFLGANLDAVAEATSLGMKKTSALNYDNTREGVKKMSVGLSASTTKYRNDAKSAQNFFDGAEHADDIKIPAP